MFIHDDAHLDKAISTFGDSPREFLDTERIEEEILFFREKNNFRITLMIY